MDGKNDVRPPSESHNNPDLLVWACFVGGGFEKWLDVEELYLLAFELAPQRLGWRTRADLPDYKKCAKALQELEDPKRSQHLGLITKNGQYMRKLSQEGFDWCTRHRPLLEALYGGGRTPATASSEVSQLIRSVEDSTPFGAWVKNGSVNSEVWEVAESLRCLPDSSRSIWMARLDLLASGGKHLGRDDLTSYARHLRKFVQEKIED